VIPPREWKRVLEKIRRLETLARQIDRGYARGRFKGIEEKEVEAERLEEELSALHDVYADASDAPWTVGEGYSLDELLIMTYLKPEQFADRGSWLENMKENVRLMVEPYNPALPISDFQILEIAQAAVAQRQDLLARYKRGKKR
jgi:hypothetical protein